MQFQIIHSASLRLLSFPSSGNKDCEPPLLSASEKYNQSKDVQEDMKRQPRLLPSWTIQTSFLLPSCPWDHFKTRGHICFIRLFSPQIHWNILRWGERGGETFRIYIDIKHRYRVFIFTFFFSYLFLFWFLIDKTWEKWLFLNFFGLYFNIHNIGNLYLNAWSPSQG